MSKKFFEDFADYDQFVDQWAGANDVTEDEVLIAGYFPGDYSGSAFCLYEKDGKLFEVYDSHCSCNGLENWRPEESNLKALSGFEFSDAGQEFRNRLDEIILERTTN